MDIDRDLFNTLLERKKPGELCNYGKETSKMKTREQTLLIMAGLGNC